MVDALAALIGQTRIRAAPIILPHSSADSAGRVKLSITPAFSFNEIRRMPRAKRASASQRMRRPARAASKNAGVACCTCHSGRRATDAVRNNAASNSETSPLHLRRICASHQPRGGLNHPTGIAASARGRDHAVSHGIGTVMRSSNRIRWENANGACRARADPAGDWPCRSNRQPVWPAGAPSPVHPQTFKGRVHPPRFTDPSLPAHTAPRGHGGLRHAAPAPCCADARPRRPWPRSRSPRRARPPLRRLPAGLAVCRGGLPKRPTNR